MAIISIPTSVAGVALPGSLGNLAKGPLSSLFAGNGVETLQYPSDLATDPTKSHYIQFSIKEIVPAGWQNSGVPSTKLDVNGLSNGFKVLSSAASQANQNFTASNPTVAATESVFSQGAAGLQKLAASIAEGIDTGAVGAAFSTFSKTIGQDIKEGLSITPQTTKPRAVISLYMPDTLIAGYESSYDNPTLQSALGPKIQALRALAQTGSQLSKDGAGGLKNQLSSDPSVIAAAAAAVGAVTSKFGGDSNQLSKLVLQAQGYAINPQVQFVYTGIGLRHFSLSFTFTPKSLDESESVDNIVSMFKYHFSPSLQAGAETQSASMFLIPPALFNINFMISGVENRYLPKYGDCVLENMEVNYAPNGFASFDNGAPVQTTLSLSFRETQIIDKAKLKKGYNSEEGGLR
jgi:hypothetical protein